MNSDTATAVKVIAAIVGIFLLVSFISNVAAWEKRGCSEVTAAVFSVIHGEPEWYEFCERK